MQALTQRQQQLLAYIEDHLAENGYPPSIREMAEHMGIRSTNGVNDHLKALERKGYLSRRAGPKSRAIQVTARPGGRPGRGAARSDGFADVVLVPLLGRVAAGAPLLAEEHIEGRLQVDRALVGRGQEVFGLTVQGDSMIERGILDGDTVFVRRQQTAEPGQVVVALIEGEATVKIFRPRADRVVFEPANSALKPIEVLRSEFRQTDLLGVVTGVFRRLR